MLYIGVDPGLNGAVAAIDQEGRVIALADTPTIKVRKGKGQRSEYVEPSMAMLLEGITQSYASTCCKDCAKLDPAIVARHTLVTIENVHAMPKQGVASSFSFGVGYGIWRGIIAALRLPCERVEPTTWKRLLGLPKAKGAAVSKACRLFPRAEIGHPYRGRMIYSDGRAEALLIAWYALQLGPTHAKRAVQKAL